MTEALIEPAVEQQKVGLTRNLKGGIAIYYKDTRGWIQPGSGQKNDMANYVESGWRPLTQYGHFQWDHYTISRPLDFLFIRGGAKELPYDQMVQEGWAYQANYVAKISLMGKEGYIETTEHPIEFPQHRTMTFPPQEECTYCNRKGTKQQIENHLEVMHREDLAPMKMAEVLGKVLRPREEAVQAVNSGVPLDPYLCGVCGSGYRSPVQLGKHVKEAHKSGNQDQG